MRTEDLKSKLEMHLSCMSQNKLTPALSGVLFKEGRMTTTDLEFSLYCDVDTDYQGVVNCERLLRAIKVLKDDEVFLKSDGDYCIITTKKAGREIRIPVCEKLENFPLIPEFTEDDFCMLFTEPIFSSIRKASAFCGKDELRSHLMAIEIGEEGTIVATDANAMYFDKNDLINPIGGSFLIDSKTFSRLNKVGDECSVYIKRKSKKIKNTIAKFCFHDFVAICKLSDSDYVNWSAVIPEDNDLSITVMKDRFTESVSVALELSNKMTDLVKFYLDEKGVVTIKSGDIQEGTEFSDRLYARETGLKGSFGANGKFLLKIIGHIKESYVRLTFSVNDKGICDRAILINDNYLLMPLVLS